MDNEQRYLYKWESWRGPAVYRRRHLWGLIPYWQRVQYVDDLDEAERLIQRLSLFDKNYL